MLKADRYGKFERLEREARTLGVERTKLSEWIEKKTNHDLMMNAGL